MGTTPECGGSVAALAAMPDNKRFFSGGYDSIIRVWLLDGTLKSAFAEVHPGHIEFTNVLALVALPDNQHMRSLARRIRPSNCSASTTAPFCARSGTTRHQPSLGLQ